MLKQILTLDEVATLTGFKSSYIYKLTSGGKIPYYKPTGKKCFFKRDEIENWLLQNRISPVDEVQYKAESILLSKKGGPR